MKDKPILVSACLLGLKTRFDAGDAYSKDALASLEGRVIIPVCPEQLGGLPTPRPRAEIREGGGADVIEGRARVIDENGRDVTAAFMRGASEVLKVARLTGAAEAYLKEKSPSCGVESIKAGSNTIAGSGVTAALLERSGLTIKGF